MKVLVASILLASSIASFAADRNIYDLMYLPKAGTSFGETGIGLITGKAEVESAVGDVDSKLEGWSVQQALGHSFTDRFLLSADMTFAHVDAKYEFDDATISDSHTTQKGLSDPSINARFRALEESFILDLIAEGTIKTGDAETDGSQINNKQGGNSLRLGAELGQKLEKFQYSFQAQFNRIFEVTDETDGDKVEEDAHNEYLVGVNGLVQVAEKSFIRGLLKAEFSDEFEDDDDSTTASVTRYTVEADYQHLCSENLLLQVGVNWQNLHTAGFDSYGLTTFIAGARYQF